MTPRTFYSTGPSNTGRHYSNISLRTEPDLRQELINTLDGEFPEISKKQTGLLRTMRRDSSNNLIPCPCVDVVSGEPDKDQFCAVCMGSGSLWDETYITFWRTLEGFGAGHALSNELTHPGNINNRLVTFYLRYSDTITSADKIIQLKLDDAGDIVTPQTRLTVYRINRFWDYRADNGRVEFYKVYTNEEDIKFLNPPSYSEQER